MNAGAIILAGGKSRRMGTNKAFLNIGEESNIERIKKSLQQVFHDIILVTNDAEEYRHLNLPIVADIYPGKGPLAGIHAGLSASSNPMSFVVACDMPFISPTLSLYLIEQMMDYDIIVPRVDGRLHTLFSVFKKSTLPVIEQSIKANRFRIQDVFDLLKVKIVEEEELAKLNVDLSTAFFNMNTLEDYEKANKLTDKHDFIR